MKRMIIDEGIGGAQWRELVRSLAHGAGGAFEQVLISEKHPGINAVDR